MYIFEAEKAANCCKLNCQNDIVLQMVKNINSFEPKEVLV